MIFLTPSEVLLGVASSTVKRVVSSILIGDHGQEDGQRIYRSAVQCHFSLSKVERFAGNFPLQVLLSRQADDKNGVGRTGARQEVFQTRSLYLGAINSDCHIHEVDLVGAACKGQVEASIVYSILKRKSSWWYLLLVQCHESRL